MSPYWNQSIIHVDAPSLQERKYILSLLPLRIEYRNNRTQKEKSNNFTMENASRLHFNQDLKVNVTDNKACWCDIPPK